jgi:hypothetical protein
MLKDLQQQNFHPQVILGSANYSNDLVSASGGAAAVDGALFDSNTSLFLGQDASAIPAVATFNKWVQKASPGFKTDLFTLYGWLSAELFSQALKNAGSNPSRGSLLQALSKVTSFSGDNIIAPNDPAAKTGRPTHQQQHQRISMRLQVHNAAGLLTGPGPTRRV